MSAFPLLCLGFLLLLACESTPDESPKPALATSTIAAEPPKASATPTEPLAPPAKEEIGSRQLWVDPKSDAGLDAAKLRFSQPKSAKLLQKLAAQPTAVWFTAANTDILGDALQLAASATGSERYAVIVLKALAKVDCGRYVSKGLKQEEYRAWIQNFVKGLGETPSYIIVEPDAILFTGCMQDQEQKDFFKLIADTVLELKRNSRAQVYLDAGQPDRLPVMDVVQRLLQAGVLSADGFAVNVGDYQWTEDCIRYGQDISQRIGGKGFVIDTARNGRGPVSREAWCNPRDRAVGETPQAPTGIKGLDAYLWISKPGVSDGSCNGGPAAGQWWQAKAIELMRNAELPD